MDAIKTMKENRKKIDDLNYGILKLISQRDSAVRKINLAKKKLGLPRVNLKREKEVIAKARAMAKKLKTNPQLAEKVMEAIIAHSRKLK
jgi:chorismate mutase